MTDRILLYISAAPDLSVEREVLGRATIEIPTTLGWRIIQTPGKNERLDLEAARQADVHLFLMGSDIHAPMGAEWMAARQAGRTPVMFLKQGIQHTPAGTIFLRDLERYGTWRPFEDAADLRRQVLELLARHILDEAMHYQLKPEEFERLRAWQKELESKEKEAVDQTRGGAGSSSVVLSPERYVPSEGTLVKRPDQGRASKKKVSRK